MPITSSILADPFVLYHGTSGPAAERISVEGFCWPSAAISQVDVRRVLAVYGALDWGGEDRGGWLVLKAYSDGWDFRNGPSKQIYFAENRHRASLYAELDFAGGETARGVRRAIADLNRLATVPDVFARYVDRLRVRESKVTAPSAEWIQSQLSTLHDLANRVSRLQEVHTHGSIFAVRFDESDLPTLEYNKMHGIMSYQRVPPSKIVGIEEVALDYRSDQFASPRIADMPCWKGIVRRLRDRDASSRTVR